MNIVIQPNEYIILKTEAVSHDSKSTSDYAHAVLTTQCIVLVKKIRKGLFGKEEITLRFPLNQIKVFDNKAQLVLKRSILEVYFVNGMEKFEFHNRGEAAQWANAINEQLTGNKNVFENQELTELDQVANAIKGTIHFLRDTFCGSPDSSKDAQPQSVAIKCSRCGAPVTGLQGQCQSCAYCGTQHQL